MVAKKRNVWLCRDWKSCILADKVALGCIVQGVWRDRSFQAAIAFGHYLEFSEITLCIMAFKEHSTTKGVLEFGTRG